MLSPGVSDPDVQLDRALQNIREVSLHIAIAVAEEVIASELSSIQSPNNLKQLIENYMYEPAY